MKQHTETTEDIDEEQFIKYERKIRALMLKWAGAKVEMDRYWFEIQKVAKEAGFSDEYVEKVARATITEMYTKKGYTKEQIRSKLNRIFNADRIKTYLRDRYGRFTSIACSREDKEIVLRYRKGNEPISETIHRLLKTIETMND